MITNKKKKKSWDSLLRFFMIHKLVFYFLFIGNVTRPHYLKVAIVQTFQLNLKSSVVKPYPSLMFRPETFERV